MNVFHRYRWLIFGILTALIGLYSSYNDSPLSLGLGLSLLGLVCLVAHLTDRLTPSTIDLIIALLCTLIALNLALKASTLWAAGLFILMAIAAFFAFVSDRKHS